MVYVNTGSAAWALRLNEGALADVLNGPGVKRALAEVAADLRGQVESHVTAVAQPENAANYVSAMFTDEGDSDDYGFEFSGPYSLGHRPIVAVGISREGRDSTAKPPFMVEADHHSLTAPLGVEVGRFGEDIR